MKMEIGKIQEAIIVIDPLDHIIWKTLRFIANVLGSRYFKILSEKEFAQHILSRQEKNVAESAKCKEILKEKIIPNGLQINIAENLCHLPVLWISSEPLVCYAGLSTVVRRMVHHLDNVNHRAKVISLLGHQETCLKSYAEASNWTKFCETDLPQSAHNLFQSVTGYDKEPEKMFPNLPPILKQLEKELKTAKNLPNHRKYHGKDKKKWISKLVAETFEKQYIEGRIEEYVDGILDGMKAVWSPYLTGFQMTVADLISFSIIIQMLLKLNESFCMKHLQSELPLLFRWLKQLIKLSVVKKAAEKQWQSTFETIGAMQDNLTPSIIENIPVSKLNSVSQSKNEQKKQKIKVHHQKEVEDVIAQITAFGISSEISDLCHDDLRIDWNILPSDLNPSKGDLNPDRALRKQKQIENMMGAIKGLAKPGYRIVDFCAGGGHTGIVLAYFLPLCEVILVENKEQSVARALIRIQNLGLQNIRICHSNLDYFCGNFQIGVSLHACGVATDLVLNTCLKNRASFVVCPCCYGSIRNIDQVSYPRSKAFQTKISLEKYLVLSHSSDMTSWDDLSAKNRCAKASMTLIDLDRCLFMRELRYTTRICTMQPPSCTPKNNLLIGECLSE